VPIYANLFGDEGARMRKLLTILNAMVRDGQRWRLSGNLSSDILL
jgi:hypothetical protein